MTDLQIGWLEDLKDLHVLWLNNTKITDKALLSVGALASLHRLHLECTGVTDKGLVHLGDLVNLVELRLEGTQVTDAGLSHLRGLPKLDWLELSGPGITGSGLARGLCAYVAVFWDVRLCLQAIFDVKEHLTAWWLKLGYHLLTALFLFFTAIYAYAALATAD